MPEFTESQLRELETVFNLTRVKTLPVKDGRVSATQQIWWRSAEGPKRDIARVHWENIKEFPELYSLAEPKYTIQYID